MRYVPTTVSREWKIGYHVIVTNLCRRYMTAVRSSSTECLQKQNVYKKCYATDLNLHKYSN